MKISRRRFNRLSALAGIACLGRMEAESNDASVPVAIVKTDNREQGIPKAVALLGEFSYKEKNVYLKCNYNSPDPYPATTHPEALRAAAEFIKSRGSQKIIVAERSGMGVTREVVEKLGALELMSQLGLGFLPLEELAAGDWKRMNLPGSNWKNGVEIPDFLAQKPCVVQVCNLKTHRFGGEFSASLKNSIGLIAKRSLTDPHWNYMEELHSSPYQCRMIAEVNQVYSPDLIIMDAIQVFKTGGPESGELASPGIIAASRDRVALDAVGLALLRHFGAPTLLNPDPVFEQEQLKRAVELKLGVQSEKEIKLLSEDTESRRIALKLESVLYESQ